MSSPDVSICITAYNHERYIAQCIESVLSQIDVGSMEILVGVDESSDNTAQVVRQIAGDNPGVIDFLEHVPRLGCGLKNYKSLVRRAKGKLIAHLDGDDYWCKDKLKHQCTFMALHPNCPAVYTNAIVIEEQGRELGIFTRPKPARITLEDLLLNGNFLNHSSVLYRSQYKQQMLDIELPYIDYQMHLRFAKQGDLGFIDWPLSVYRINTPSSVRITDNSHVVDLYLKAILVETRDIDSSALVQKSKAQFMAQQFWQSQFALNPVGFWKWWWQLLQQDTSAIKLLFRAVTSVLCRSGYEIHGFCQRRGILAGTRFFH